jgi:hypothetical protein
MNFQDFVTWVPMVLIQTTKVVKKENIQYQLDPSQELLIQHH